MKYGVIQDLRRKETKSRYLDTLNTVQAGLGRAHENKRLSDVEYELVVAKVRRLAQKVRYKKYCLTSDDMVFLNHTWEHYCDK